MNWDEMAEHAQAKFGLTITDTQLEQMRVLHTALLDWNANRANLTAITEPGQVITRHFLDSLSIMGHFIFARGQRVMDVGTGAGFPGLVLKIVRPDLTLTLVDSVGKKTTFLTHVTERLSLDNVQILTARAEDLGQNPQHREGYEVVMARAVAQLPTLAEYLLPLCRVGGVCLAMKGENLPEELAAAQSALKILGGNARPPIPIQLPEGEQRHYLLFIDKQRPTPSAYPRRAGVPRKTPLGPGD